MNAWSTVFLPAAFGSALQELLYWYESRKKLSNKVYQAQLRSVIEVAGLVETAFRFL
jgi:hypothetical protein